MLPNALVAIVLRLANPPGLRPRHNLRPVMHALASGSLAVRLLVVENGLHPGCPGASSQTSGCASS